LATPALAGIIDDANTRATTALIWSLHH